MKVIKYNKSFYVDEFSRIVHIINLTNKSLNKLMEDGDNLVYNFPKSGCVYKAKNIGENRYITSSGKCKYYNPEKECIELIDTTKRNKDYCYLVDFEVARNSKRRDFFYLSREMDNKINGEAIYKSLYSDRMTWILSEYGINDDGGLSLSITFYIDDNNIREIR